MSQGGFLAFAITALFGLGLIIGSFLNVVIARVPDGRSVVRPRSACPGCGVVIGARDNIPVLSWLVLRGRCRACGIAISPRYPLVEFGTGVLWAVFGWWSWTHGVPWTLPVLVVVGSAGIALACIDLDHHRLPNAIVLPLLPVAAVGLAVPALAGQIALAPCLIAAGIWVAVIGVLWLGTGGRGMGLGDVKLAPTLGATCAVAGLGAAVVGLGLAFVLGGLLGIALLVAGKARRRTRIPFGPFLLAGALLGLLVGQPVWQAYRSLAGW